MNIRNILNELKDTLDNKGNGNVEFIFDGNFSEPSEIKFRYMGVECKLLIITQASDSWMWNSFSDDMDYCVVLLLDVGDIMTGYRVDYTSDEHSVIILEMYIIEEYAKQHKNVIESRLEHLFGEL